MLEAGDSLFLDTLALGETGALNQSITVTVGSSVGSFSGFASWFVSQASRLTGVDVTLWRGGTRVGDDTLQGLLGGTAVSSLGPTGLAAGTCTLQVFGKAARDPSLDVALVFAPVPKPATVAMLAAGLGIVTLVARRRRATRAPRCATPAARPRERCRRRPSRPRRGRGARRAASP